MKSRLTPIADFAFYLGLALLFSHELDAMPNHEWRLLPILRSLPDAAGETAFMVAHIPIFAIVIGCIASLNVGTRSVARTLVSAFLVLHAGLHFLFSKNETYEFGSMASSLLIYGAAILGAAFLLARWLDKRKRIPR